MSVVAEHHRRWWEGPLWSLPPANVVVQPQNKGTAAGLLLPLLHLAQRDPDATVIVLPSDHYVANEAVLARSLRQAAQLAATDRDSVFLLGVTPDEIDPELGYVVPESIQDLGAARVARFAEKPALAVARQLIAAGALWNVFILAASVRALLNLYLRRCPSLLQRMRVAVAHDALEPRGRNPAASRRPAPARARRYLPRGSPKPCSPASASAIRQLT